MITSATKPLVLGLALCVLLAAMILGLLAIPYGVWVEDSAVRIIALPAVLALLFLLVIDKTKLFLLIVLLRAPIDQIVVNSRVMAFLGLGAALNAFMIFIAALFVVQQPRTATRTALPMWGPFLAVVVLAVARAPDFVGALRSALVLFSYAAVFTVPFYVKECRRDLRLCLYVVLLSSLIPSIFGFVDFAQGPARAEFGGRIASTLSHPNIFAFYLVLTIALTFYLMKSRTLSVSTAQRLLFTAYIGILLVLLVLTKTRAGWAACATVFLVYGLLFERRYLVYIAIVGALALLVPDIRERINDVSLQSNPINSFEWRRSLWESAWNWMRWQDIPLGHGLASFPYYSSQFSFQYFLPGGPGIGAHNVYLEVLFETGIVGLACLGWLYYRLLRIVGSCFDRDRLRTVVIVAIISGYLVASFSDNMLAYLPFNWYFWFVMGSACAIALREQDEARQATRAEQSGVPATAAAAAASR